LEDLAVHGRILECILKKYDGGTKWVYLAHDKGRLQAFLNTELTLLFPPNAEKLD
jgi:hypothetical protein